MENMFYLYKKIWARGLKNDPYSPLFRQRHLSTLLKRKTRLIPFYGDIWITLYTVWTRQTT